MVFNFLCLGMNQRNDKSIGLHLVYKVKSIVQFQTDI